MDKVVVIIPTLNEAPGIGPTIEEIKKELANPKILVIDADSVDGTGRIATLSGAKVLRQFPVGKGSAFAIALRNIPKDISWLVMVDGDYAMPAVYILHMIKILEKRKDVGMVSGRRLGPRGEYFSLSRHFVRRPVHNLQHFLQHYGIRALHRMLNKVKMEDPTSGFRVMRYDCLKDFRPKAKGFDIEVEINHHIHRKGYEIVELPIKIRPRLGLDKFRYPKHGPLISFRIIMMAAEDVALWFKALINQLSKEIRR